MLLGEACDKWTSRRARFPWMNVRYLPGLGFSSRYRTGASLFE
jgi:hypothetical protein